MRLATVRVPTLQRSAMRVLRGRPWWLLALLLPVGAGSAIDVAAQGACDGAVAEAEEEYLEGRFDAAAQLLSACLEQAELPTPEVVRVHRLLTLAYINQGDAQGARQAIEGLLEAAPDYEPDPVQDPPSYTVLVLIVKEQQQEKAVVEAAAEAEAQRSWLRKRRTWLAVGVGLVVVGVVAVVTGDGAE